MPTAPPLASATCAGSRGSGNGSRCCAAPVLALFAWQEGTCSATVHACCADRRASSKLTSAGVASVCSPPRVLPVSPCAQAFENLLLLCHLPAALVRSLPWPVHRKEMSCLLFMAEEQYEKKKRSKKKAMRPRHRAQGAAPDWHGDVPQTRAGTRDLTPCRTLRAGGARACVLRGRIYTHAVMWPAGAVCARRGAAPSSLPCVQPLRATAAGAPHADAAPRHPRMLGAWAAICQQRRLFERRPRHRRRA